MSESQQLADLLQELKERSGRTYSALASRTGLSRSSVHRYCQGLTVPASFGVVERIARVCGAGQEELDRLYQAWTRADAAAGNEAEELREDRRDREGRRDRGDREGRRDQGDREGRRDRGDREPRAAVGGAPQGSRGRLRSWARARLRVLLVAALLVAAVAASVVYLDRPPGPGPAPDPGTGVERTGSDSGSDNGSGGTAGQQITAPYWKQAPKPINREFFGVTMNTNTGYMPGFPVSGVRFWESETRWSKIQPKKGQFNWEILERSVRGAERKGLPVVFTFGGTPGWAAPAGPKTPYGDDSRAAPPGNLDDWDHFVERVATRYRSRIGAYELWDSVGATSHYDGSMSTLAEMVRRASRIIKRVDPDALVACPSFGKLWERQGRALLEEFARTGAYDSCDAAALKLHPRRAGGPPEEIIELAEKAQHTLRKGDAGQRLWNTGPGAEIADGTRLSERRANDYAVRFYLVGLYSRNSSVDRMYFYAWGGRNLPVVVQVAGAAPTEAGRRIGRLHGWLADKRITACGKGAGMGLPDGVFECVFRRGQDREPDAAGPRLAVRWTQQGEATGELGEGVRLLRRMDGTSERVRPGERVKYGETPVLVEYRK